MHDDYIPKNMILEIHLDMIDSLKKNIWWLFIIFITDPKYDWLICKTSRLRRATAPPPVAAHAAPATSRVAGFEDTPRVPRRAAWPAWFGTLALWDRQETWVNFLQNSCSLAPIYTAVLFYDHKWLFTNSGKIWVKWNKHVQDVKWDCWLSWLSWPSWLSWLVRKWWIW